MNINFIIVMVLIVLILSLGICLIAVYKLKKENIRLQEIIDFKYDNQMTDYIDEIDECNCCDNYKGVNLIDD